MDSLLSQTPKVLSDSTVTRELVAAEARSWLATPYHRRAALKGVGVDCGMLPYAVLRKFELIPSFDPKYLPDDWFSHTSRQEYLKMVETYLRKLVDGRAYRNLAAPVGSLALVKVVGSERFNHSGIVTQWPYLVHATYGGVMEADASVDPMWATKEVIIFDPFPEDTLAG